MSFNACVLKIQLVVDDMKHVWLFSLSFTDIPKK